MPKRKVIARLGEQVFTRTTDRDYKFVLVGRKDPESLFQARKRSIVDYADRDWATICMLADGSHPKLHLYSEAEIAEAKLNRAAGRDAWLQGRIERTLGVIRNDSYPWVALTWASRRDLVESQHRRYSAEAYCMAELKILPVEVM